MLASSCEGDTRSATGDRPLMRATLKPSPFIAVVAGLLCSSAVGAEAPCESGWLHVRASIVTTIPKSAPVYRVGKSGKRSEVIDPPLLCEGDTLILEPPLRFVEVLQGGNIQKVEVSARQWTVPHGPAVASAAIAAQVGRLMDLMTVFSTPVRRPAHTGARSPGAETTPRAVGFLDRHGVAYLTGDRAAIVAWKGGEPPFACTADTTPPQVAGVGNERWCEFSGTTISRGAGSIGMSAGDGQTVTWKIERRDWRNVPRPYWIPSMDNGPDIPFDEFAWAVWLWREGPPEWRLQSLSMLNSAAGSEYLAGYLLNLTLNDTPPLPPAKDQR
jgi:hypothetical protein